MNVAVKNKQLKNSSTAVRKDYLTYHDFIKCRMKDKFCKYEKNIKCRH